MCRTYCQHYLHKIPTHSKNNFFWREISNNFSLHWLKWLTCRLAGKCCPTRIPHGRHRCWCWDLKISNFKFQSNRLNLMITLGPWETGYINQIIKYPNILYTFLLRLIWGLGQFYITYNIIRNTIKWPPLYCCHK
jgi:hypothetical protein